MSSDAVVESFGITFNTKTQGVSVVTACTEDNKRVFQLMVMNSECQWGEGGGDEYSETLCTV